MDTLLQVDEDGGPPTLGGMGHAIEAQAFALLEQEWGRDQSLLEWERHLQEAQEEGKRPGELVGAVADLCQAPEWTTFRAKPLDHLTSGIRTLLSGSLAQRFLQREVAQCLQAFSPTVVQIQEALERNAIQTCTLIPSGALGAFPLHAALLPDGQPFCLRYPTSVASSARIFLAAHERQERLDRLETSEHPPGAERSRSPQGLTSLSQDGEGFSAHRPTAQEDPGVEKTMQTFADPRPSRRPLLWSEGEAKTIAHYGAQLGVHARAIVGEDVTAERVLAALQGAWLVDLGCHGAFRPQDPLRSALRLAQGQALTMDEILGGIGESSGLRLLILSACQTALFDLRGARNEMRSLAGAFLLAGAQAVVSTLWPVDDEATYLLMTRFVYEWLLSEQNVLLAQALARAQNWLRSVTNEDLQSWRAALPEDAHVAHLVTEIASERRERVALRGHEKELLLGEECRVLRGGTRYEPLEAVRQIHARARDRAAPKERPFQEPYYWAGFTVLGW